MFSFLFLPNAFANNKKLIWTWQAQLEKEAEEDNQYRQQLEQERRDHELAMRLAQESNSQVDDSPLLMRKYETFSVQIFIYCF